MAAADFLSTVAATPGSRASLLHLGALYRIDRRQVIHHQLPVVALVPAVENLAVDGANVIPIGSREVGGHAFP